MELTAPNAEKGAATAVVAEGLVPEVDEAVNGEEAVVATTGFAAGCDVLPKTGRDGAGREGAAREEVVV